jgi:hypothetical protein
MGPYSTALFLSDANVDQLDQKAQPNTSFNTIPAEMRSKIMRMAADSDPNDVHLRLKERNLRDGTAEFEWKTKTTVPATLQVNFASRQECEKKYVKVSYGSREIARPYIYFNPLIDTMYLWIPFYTCEWMVDILNNFTVSWSKKLQISKPEVFLYVTFLYC